MTELTELFTTNDMVKLKSELARLVKAKDYKAINTLLRRNPNTWLFDTRELNEEIPCKERHFVKRKGALKFETPTSPRVVKQAAPHKDVYEARLYDPHSGSYGYVSRIRARY